MLQKTRGIVIHYLKFKESSIIAKVYTEALGIQTYIINGVRSRKAKNNKIAFFQPLTLLEMVVYHRPHREQINRISEIKCAYPFQSIPFDMKKTGIAMFMAEVMQKSLKEEGENELLFNFLWEQIKILDQQTTQYENLHLFFLIRLSAFLGFAPEEGAELLRQIEEHKTLLLDAVLYEQLEITLGHLVNTEDIALVQIPAAVRPLVIDCLIDFYKLHVANFEGLKSLGVLREINRG